MKQRDFLLCNIDRGPDVKTGGACQKRPVCAERRSIKMFAVWHLLLLTSFAAGMAVENRNVTPTTESPGANASAAASSPDSPTMNVEEGNTTSSDYAYTPIGDEYPTDGDYDDYKYECANNADCELYHFCFHSIWFGSVCETYHKRDNIGSYRISSCKRSDADGEREWPDHDACAANENHLQTPPAYSTSRCYEELGFTCQKSYLMPCTPNYDGNGTLIEGEQESCPPNFTCESVTWNEGAAHVCVPVPTREPWPERCETPFDCGYSDLEGGWPSCWRGKCERMEE